MATRPLNILICDDSEDDRFFFKEALQGISIPSKLIAITNGEELMEYLSNNSKHPLDVIFLDLNMPRKNGFECLKEIKKNDLFKAIPVIILSTTNYSKAIDDTYKAGAFLYMIKPSSIVILKNEIERALLKIRENPLKKMLRNKFVLTVEEIN